MKQTSEHMNEQIINQTKSKPNTTTKINQPINQTSNQSKKHINEQTSMRKRASKAIRKKAPTNQ